MVAAMWRACLWLLALLLIPAAASAQISNEQLVNNHPTLSTYQRSYTPATGSDRVVIAIIFSEYDRTQSSFVTSATLGGVPLQPLGTIEGVRAKRNRMSAFILREADIPAGTSTFRVNYGPDPASSLIYLATVLNVDQASVGNPPRAFARDCSVQNASSGGTIAFGAVAARGNDYVFSFAGTGQNTAFTTFNNGASELFDERVFGPGFSFAGGVQVPIAPTTIAGNATLSSGCNNRPSTFQLVLRPLLGTDAQLTAPPVRTVGQTVTIDVADADQNTRASVRDSFTVTVRNQTTGETEPLLLTETGPNTGIFRAILPTQDGGPGPNNNGTINGRAGQRLEITYQDRFNTDGAARTLVRITRLVQTDAPASLRIDKTSRMLEASGVGRFAVPQADVVYTLTVTNSGDGATDSGTVFVVDVLPPELIFFNGDFQSGDSDTGAVRADPGETGLAFSAATDLRFAGAGSPPADFAACNLSATGGYDENIRYVCIRPQGAMLPDDPNSTLTLRFRARIR